MAHTNCPSCGHEVILGTDRCPHCLHSMMQRDLPRAKKSDKLQSTMMTTPVSELAAGEVLVASKDDTVKKVVEIFQKERRDCVLVYDHHRLVGILSNRDLLQRVAGKKEDLASTKVSEVMTPSPEYVRSDDPIAYVVNKMSLGGFRHVPVLASDGAPLNSVAISDVISFLTQRKK